jgi:hypothetical protein
MLLGKATVMRGQYDEFLAFTGGKLVIESAEAVRSTPNRLFGTRWRREWAIGYLTSTPPSIAWLFVPFALLPINWAVACG